MRISDAVRLGFQGAERHPLRAFLAALSIAIGIATLVTIVAGEQSWQQALNRWYEGCGVDVIMMKSSFSGAVTPNLPKTADETRRFLAACPSVSAGTPVADGWVQVKPGREKESCHIRGLLPGFERIFGTGLMKGRFFTNVDDISRAPVCVVDADCARLVFGNRDMLGKDIRISAHRMRVIGIASKLGYGGLQSHVIAMAGEIYPERIKHWVELDAGIAIPLSTGRRTLGLPVSRFHARAGDHSVAIHEVGRYFGLDPNLEGEQRWLWSLASEKAAALQARERVRLFVGLAALLVLLAAGIGLATVMYVAVNERQPEIGIHRALGATRTVIGATFFLESAWLGIAGAVAGLGLGLLGARYLGTVTFPYEFTGGPGGALNTATSVLPRMRASVEWQTAAVAATAALCVAAMAGYAPASEAAHLNPSRAMTTGRPAERRLRRALTGIQLSVGIAAVLVLTSIHEGIALELLGPIARFSQAETVTTDLTLARSGRQMLPVAKPMKALARDPEQIGAIGRECPAFRSIESQLAVHRRTIKRGRYALDQCGATAVTAGYFRAEGMRPLEGRLFRTQEVRDGMRVVVLTDRAAGALELDRAAGETVRVGGLPFRVVGVVRKGADHGFTLTGIPSQWAYVPVTSIPASWTSGYPHTAATLRCHLRSGSNYRRAERQLRTALAKRLPSVTMKHIELRGNIPDRLRLTGMRRAAAWRASVIGLSAILVAVIGLVNMLLVSVAQQTREIGLRRALGATRLAIGAMVLLEALLVCVPGCLVGIGVGAIASRFVGGWAQLPVALPVFWISTSIGVALGVGLLASLIPAWRAAMVDPVVALRQE